MRVKRTAMTLVELLISLFLAGLVGASVVGLLFVFITNFQVNADLSEARQRAEMVFTLLGKPVRQAGLGIPLSGDLFDQSVFDDALVKKGALASLAQGRLSQPLETPPGDRSILYGLYSVPTGFVVAEEEKEFDALMTSVPVALTSSSGGGNPDLISENVTAESRGWVVFPATRAVFQVDRKPTSSDVKLTPMQEGTFSLFDEMHVLRVLEAKVESGDFIMQDPTTNERFGTIEGIVAVRFYFDDNSRVLTAWVLARGGSRQDRIVTDGEVLQWEDENGNPWNIDSEWRHYRLNVLTASWRIRN